MAEEKPGSRLEQIIRTSVKNAEERTAYLELIREDPLLQTLPSEYFQDAGLLTAVLTLVAKSTPLQRSDPLYNDFLSKAIKTPEILRNLASLSHLSGSAKDAIFAGMYAGMTVANGKGREKGTVIVDVASFGPISGHRPAKISLWKSLGQAYSSLSELEEATNAVHLLTKECGSDIHYVDTDVSPRTTYNYYAAMHYTSGGQVRYSLAFDVLPHAVLDKESPITYADRRIAEHSKMEELRRKTLAPEPLDPVGLASKIVDDLLHQGTVLTRVNEVIDEKLNALAISEVQKKLIRAEVKRAVMNALDKGSS